MTEKMCCVFTWSAIVFLTIFYNCHGQVVPNEFRRQMSKLRIEEFIDQMLILPQNGSLGSNSTACHSGAQGQECSSAGRISSNLREQLIANIAQQDVCAPHLVTVPVPSEPDPRIVIYPSCVLVERCAGCSGLQHEECAPVAGQVQFIPLLVMETRYGAQDSSQVDYSRTKTVWVEKHLRCESQCKVLPEHCHEDVHSSYDGNNCQCICKNVHQQSRCVSPKQWDGSMCECICPRVKNCDTRNHYAFNTDTCSCESRSLSSGAGLETSASDPSGVIRRLDEATVERLRGMITNTHDTATTQPTTETTQPTTETTQSTTTTTTEAPTTQPCANTVCGDYFKAAVMNNGLCGCILAFDFPGKK